MLDGSPLTITCTGSCHCGGVRFEADIDPAAGTRRCNCTFCTKSRFWKAFVGAASFRLIAHETLADYEFGERNVTHHFCARCGVRTFSHGHAAAADGGFYIVNVACLDAEPDALLNATIRYEDGRNDNWWAVPAETRHL